MPYERIDTVKVKDPNNPGEFIIINAMDYGDGRAFTPDLYPVWGTPAQRSTRAPARPGGVDDEDDEKTKASGASAPPVRR
jgi:hypothetical protein